MVLWTIFVEKWYINIICQNEAWGGLHIVGAQWAFVKCVCFAYLHALTSNGCGFACISVSRYVGNIYRMSWVPPSPQE